MWVNVDLRTCPPALSLGAPDDFTSFKVVVQTSEHAFISDEALRQLAGPLADDPDWGAQLGDMVAFARLRGWVDDHERIQAHVEYESLSEGASAS